MQPYYIVAPCLQPHDSLTVGCVGRFKFACSLRDGSGSHYCACALIAPSVVLTAAHCVNQTDPALRNPAVEVGVEW